jgi:hypothetical protein
MSSSEIVRRVALLITDVSEEYSASIMKVTKIGELGTHNIPSQRASVTSYC